MCKVKNGNRKHQSNLSDRLKDGELYVALTGFDLEASTMSFLCYGDRIRSPRIYKRGAVDDRLLPTLPVCRLFSGAVRRLKKTHPVLLPLSEMIKIWGPGTVKRWAAAQRHVTPEEVHDYVARHVSMAA